MECGRPTFLIVRPDEEPVVVTPLMESEMVSAMTWVLRIAPWVDAGPNRWEKVLARVLGERPGAVGNEAGQVPAMVRNWLDERQPGSRPVNVSPILAVMRMIKSPAEIAVMRQAGNRTVLQPGMTFAVDGDISVDGQLGGRIGDSVVVTETGTDFPTRYPRRILVVDR